MFGLLLLFFFILDEIQLLVRSKFCVTSRENKVFFQETTRLTLRGHGLVAHLTAMTVQHGGPDLFDAKRKALGHDPLRTDSAGVVLDLIKKYMYV